MTSLARFQANRENAQKSTGPKTLAGRRRCSKNAVRHGLLSNAYVLPFVEKTKDWEAHKDALFATLKPNNHVEDLLVERIAVTTWRLARLAKYENEILVHSQNRAEYNSLPNTINNDDDVLWYSDCLPISHCRSISDIEDMVTASQKTHEAFTRFIQAVDDPEALAKVSSDDVYFVMCAVAKKCGLEYDEWTSLFSIPKGVDPIECDGFTGPEAWEAIKKMVAEDESEEEDPRKALMDAHMASGKEAKETVQTLQEAKWRLERARTNNLVLEGLRELDKFSRYEAHLERSLYRALHELERLQVRRSGGHVPPPAVVDFNINAANPEVSSLSDGGFVSQK